MSQPTRKKKRKILIGSLGGLAAGGATPLNPLPPFVAPYVSNLEGDALGETVPELEAKITHYDMFQDTSVVALPDTGLLTPIVGPSFTQVLADNVTSIGDIMQLPPGFGYTPNGGNTVLIELVMNTYGIGFRIDVYMLDSASQDGILFGLLGTLTTFLDTRAANVGTRKLNSSITGIASSPMSNNTWFYLGVQYDQSNNQVYARVIEFGSIPGDQEDSGWISQGIVASPTFSQSLEWTRFAVVVQSNTTATKGYAQMRVGDPTVDGYGLGARETHNYRDPPGA